MLGEAVGFILGLAAAVAGADLFVRAASTLASRTGVSPVVIGLTVVAWGTSTPELAVSLQAVRTGGADVAIGNVVGSNVLNVGIILGVSAMIQPMRVTFSVVRQDVPVLLGATLLFCGLYAWPPLSRLDGAVLLTAFAVSTLLAVRAGRQPVSPDVHREFQREQPRLMAKPWVAVGSGVAGLGLLLYGGDIAQQAAVAIARMVGMSELVVGLTIVAAGTSTPELLTSVFAALRGHADIAIGNVVGSNIFNLTVILGLSSVLEPMEGGILAHLDLVALVASSLVLLPIARSGFVVSRIEGASLVGAYAVYVLVMFV